MKQEDRENHGDDERKDHPDQRLDGVDQIASVVEAGGVENHLAQRGHYGHVLQVVATKTICAQGGH